MQKKQIGRSNLMIAPLVFGGNVLGWTADEKRSFELLDAFTDAGFNMIDTADIYSRWASGIGGESENILGKWIASRNNRSKIIIASKVGMDMGGGKKGLSKKYIFEAIDNSLKRLKTDYIDLYQSHQDDLSVAPEETLSAYDTLIKVGKIRYIGASNFTEERLKLSLEVSEKNNLPRYECLQPHFNLLRRDLFKPTFEQLCLNEQVGVITYFSLASGFLTGKYRQAADNNKSVRGSGMSSLLDKRGRKILDALDVVAATHHCEPASISLAWLMLRKSITAPIASATSIEQLNTLMQAASVQLTDNEIDLLNQC